MNHYKYAGKSNSRNYAAFPQAELANLGFPLSTSSRCDPDSAFEDSSSQTIMEASYSTVAILWLSLLTRTGAGEACPTSARAANDRFGINSVEKVPRDYLNGDFQQQ